MLPVLSRSFVGFGKKIFFLLLNKYRRALQEYFPLMSRFIEGTLLQCGKDPNAKDAK